MKPDTSQYQLLPDEHFEDDETISASELFAGIKQGLEEAITWEKGEGAACVTEFVDGIRTAPQEMTKAEFDARRTASPLHYSPDVDALCIRFAETPIAYSDEIMPGVIVNFDESGHVVSAEVLDVSKRIQPSSTEEAA